ncbi:MAG: Bax inhibitor-1 family protein [Saezia sp.]
MKYDQQMNPDVYAAGAVEYNKVLRNTYWLLAISMIPTVLGASIGVYFNPLAGIGSWTHLIVFFAGAYGLMFAVEKNKNSSLGLVFLFVFTFFMGFMLSDLLSFVLGRYRNGAQLIALAFGGTSAIFFVMASLATVIKRDLSPIGKFLTVGMLLAVAVGVSSFFFSFSTPMMLAFSVIVMAISSAFLLYKVQQIVRGGETNYISATLSIYVSLYNIFQSLLHIFSIFGGED